MRKAIQSGRAEEVKLEEVKLGEMGTGAPSDGVLVLEDVVLAGLLEEIRQAGRAFQHRKNGDVLDYSKLAQSLSEHLASNVYMLDKGGNILGYAWLPGYTSQRFSDLAEANGRMPEALVERANRCGESQISDEDAYLLDDESGKKRVEKHLIYVPIYAAAERLGTAVLVRLKGSFTVRDVLIAEYLGTLVGGEMLHDRNRGAERDSRDYTSVQMAMKALSYSEVESMKHLIEELDGFEGIAIASKVADKVGVTRSVIVNALRKLESAGLVESRSLGMKGTYIKVLCPLFAKELIESHPGRTY
jgi:transcriptional pleiotropic repressor